MMTLVSDMPFHKCIISPLMVEPAFSMQVTYADVSRIYTFQ